MWLCAAGVLRVAKEMAERRLVNAWGNQEESGTALGFGQGGILLQVNSGSEMKREGKKRMEIPSQPDRGQMLGMSEQTPE